MPAIELCEYIEALREELQHAIEHGDGKDLRFWTEKVDLELAVSIETGGGGKGEAKFRFFVFDATVGANAKVGTKATQTLKLSLAPVYKGKRGAEFFISDQGKNTVG